MLRLLTFREIPCLLDGENNQIELSNQEMALLVYAVVEKQGEKAKDFVGELLSTRSKNKRGLVAKYLSTLADHLPEQCFVSSDPVEFAGITCDAVELQNAADERVFPNPQARTLYQRPFLGSFSGGRHATEFGLWRDFKAELLRKKMEILWHRELLAAKEAGDFAVIRELALWAVDRDPAWEEAHELVILTSPPKEAVKRAEMSMQLIERSIGDASPKLQTLYEESLVAAARNDFTAELPRPWVNVSRGVPQDAPRPRRSAEVRYEYDVFLASPMDALPAGEYEADRETISTLAQRLRATPGTETVFYAGDTRQTRARFDDPARALRSNLEVLRSSRTFVMIYPSPLPSSTLVEASFALAWGIPGMLCVRERKDLPYLLRSVTDIYPEMLIRSFVDLEDLYQVITEELMEHAAAFAAVPPARPVGFR